MGGIGTWEAVIVSLLLATGRNSKLKINHGQSINEKKQNEINFIAYNLSDVSMSLKFYGAKKLSNKVFIHTKDSVPEVVKAVEFQ